MGPRKLWPDPAIDTFIFEKALRQQGYDLIAGLDEAGRGPLAGPVVAAGVVLPAGCQYQLFRDSKKLTARARLRLFAELKKMDAAVGVGLVSGVEIDELNILQASLLAMRKAIAVLSARPDFLLVDGTFPVPVPIPQQTLCKGESRSASIAAASIVAKVTRDRLMAEYHQQYPQYNFATNMGYPTAGHRRALKKHGPCPIHRRSFRGVREHFPGAFHDRGAPGPGALLPSIDR
jgi:ribonuclease HII